MTRELTIQIDHGGGAVSRIPDPAANADGGLDWCLRYSDPTRVRFIAASVVDSFEYIISPEINMAEATRRLRQMRAAYRARMTPPA